jgi:protein-tyrosine phosphatase
MRWPRPLVPLRDLVRGSAPVRARRAARARRAFQTAQSVLFVCKGNICRSPFAELYARGVLGDGVRVASAGYNQKSGKPSPPEALVAARELGVSLDAHRSQPITEEMVRRSDVIFVFDRKNYDHLVGLFRFARGKIHCLGYLDDDGVLDIVDPDTRGLDDFRATYRRIATTLASARR